MQLKQVCKQYMMVLKIKKSFDDIKKTFEYKNADLSDLKSDYEALLSNIGNDYTLTSITFKDITLKKA